MPDTIQLKPRDHSAFIGWQFLGQLESEWPAWVRSCCTLQRDADGTFELRHARRSGAQIVYLREWLVRDLDGGVEYYTEREVVGRFW